MAINHLAAFANCDTATIVWKTDNFIPECRGFALERESENTNLDSFVHTWVGFKGEKHKKGESRPSTTWPVQRYIWSDYEVDSGDKVRYRVIPMIRKNGKLDKAAQSEWSGWTEWVTIGTGTSKGFSAYFNRGIVPSQVMARNLPAKNPKATLSNDIATPGSSNRNFLSGRLRVEMLQCLKQAKDDGVEIYAALYELNDPELIEALKEIGSKCYLLLGSGAFHGAKKASPGHKAQPAVPDENVDVRKDLKEHSTIHVFDRIVKGQHFAHNKFLIICDQDGNAAQVWTGSTNWTVTGLCTQVNNGVLIDSPALAADYLARWKELKDAKADYPPSIKSKKASTATLGSAKITAWQDPCVKFGNLIDAKKRINAAKQGVIFLQFNPGTGDGKKKEKALIQDILALDPEKLFIHGVLNQDPGGKKAPLIQLTHKGKSLGKTPISAILPKSITSAEGKNYFQQEFSYNMVMIHSKVIVIDPFGDKPVVITGSYNMGPKASAMNDDNIVIIENAPGLAAEYAVNILGVYGHYKWLFNAYLAALKIAKDKKVKISPQYDGNDDNDQWQNRYTSGPNLSEIDFWLGIGKSKSAAHA